MVLHKLHPRLQDYVKEKWRGGLTEIQQTAFDPIYSGESCIIEAPTSGAKTEAVLFPLLTRIAGNRSKGFKVLYIAPLKALLNDLELRIGPYSKMCYMEAFKWHGDVSQDDKVQQMVFPSDLLLTTPESIEAILLRKGNWTSIFANLETIVIDEAHYFGLTERGAHLAALLERLSFELGRQPQRIAITATIGNPGELLDWLTAGRAGTIVKVTSRTQKERRFKVCYFPEEYPQLKPTLYQMLPGEKTIVFARSRTTAEELASFINTANSVQAGRVPIKVSTHHSSVSKGLREVAEASIKMRSESALDAIISTSTLELGIDIGDLDQVIQINGLNSSGSFLQRVGRTGRREGRPQRFVGLCEEATDLVPLIACVSLGLARVSERILFPHRAFHILAHQVICLCLQKQGATANYLWEVLSPASPFREIQQNEFDRLIRYMIESEYLRQIDHQTLVTGDLAEQQFLHANWRRLFAIFDTGPMYQVLDGKRIIGTLDTIFASVQQLPFVFVLGGQEWNAIKIDHELQQVKVVRNTTGIAPKWSALPMTEIPFELAQEIGRLLTGSIDVDFLDPWAGKQLERERAAYTGLAWDESKWIIDASGLPYVNLWTFAGNRINRTLNYLLSDHNDWKVRSDHASLRIQLPENDSNRWEKIYHELSGIISSSPEELIRRLTECIKASWFSKFSDCLPEELTRATLVEKSMDVKGLIRELNAVAIVTPQEASK